MMVGSKSSNQRPDTLMQTAFARSTEILLHRTAGPYIWVSLVGLTVPVSLPLYPPKAEMKQIN
jgi:hypothetical protein